MKSLSFILFGTLLFIKTSAQHYIPAAENLKARETFQNDKFGLFIHWGIFSIPAAGEWVMNDRSITVKNYKRLVNFFYPMHFNAKEWVSMAKNAGMKYITLITRHHDGFSMWDTKYTDYNIMHTPYKKDVVKMVADECHKQGIQLFLYYSLLDWSREDYPHETGRTGQHSGRKGHGDYAHYLQFMKNQLTELLTHYGKIAGIWFDGHWDQTAPEGATDRTSRINWRYDEIYGLIHKLQPQCLIGNNHHLTPFDGEDFQMFEKDLPGQNNSGLSFQKPSQQLPLETCETMNNSWGYNIADTDYKSVKQLLHYLISAAGRNANFLLNVGPMPDGKVQPEFIDTLKAIGQWMKEYGNTIYNTRGNIIPPQKWGVVTANQKVLYVHITDKPEGDSILLPAFKGKIISGAQFKTGNKVKYTTTDEGTYVYLSEVKWQDADTVIELRIQ
ncbi:MAG TPA: alpha-L-fucosidase [Chitinophagaceae bacterium]|nr:alpha-L-fucosidase [Chitinophagaceae bacterium]